MYIGVDLGTSSIKILLADGSGRIIDSQSAGYPIYYPGPNWSEQNPEDWWKGFCEAVGKLADRHDLSQVKGLSFSGQMHGLVLLDSNDRVIRNAILWNDGRTAQECRELNEAPGREKLLEFTGNIALTGFTAPKILWIRKNEKENFDKIARIMLPKDYLAYRLTGVFATDVSDASGTLLFDVRNRCWSKPMLQFLGIHENQLPKVCESVDVIGSLNRLAARETGLPPEAKVIIGGGDQAMGAIGTGTTHDAQVSIQLGTSGVIFVNSKQYVLQPDAALHSFCNACGEYHLMGVTLSCAGSTKWWVEDVLGQSDYEKVFAGIKDLPLDDLLYLPYLIGERSPINDPDAKGTLYGLNVAHDQKSITRAVVEGVCFSLKDVMGAVERSGIHPASARVIGGGAKSGEWLQMLADILDLEIRTVNTTEGGGQGAVILAMTACGDFSSIDEACRSLIREDKRYSPNKEKTSLYNQKFLRYKHLYETLK